MEATELLSIIAQGEDSRNQFKADFTNELSVAIEMIAFSNTEGGKLFIGVNKDGSISGLANPDVERINQLISNAASQSTKPPINPLTENIILPDGIVMVVTVPNGLNKPYMDKNGVIWVKVGSDKRKATAREEIQRLFQSSGLIHGDEVPITNSSIADFDIEYFKKFYKDLYDEDYDSTEETNLPSVLRSMNLMKDEFITVSGLLLLGKQPRLKLPAFIVKAMSFSGNDIDDSNYLDSNDIHGKLDQVFKATKNFVLANIKHIQNDQSVNTTGEPEIPEIVLEELIVNALIHRDYFVSSPIKLFVFGDRIEIISPGHLPNNLTIDNIKRGNSNMRNPILAGFATSAKVVPYRGIGSGIRRALKAYPCIQFIEDREDNFFKVIIQRETN